LAGCRTFGLESSIFEAICKSIPLHELLEPRPHFGEGHVDVLSVNSWSSCSNISAAETSMSVIASQWIITHDTSRDRAILLTWVRDNEQLAKNNVSLDVEDRPQ
jgi:hypothetical protein